MSIEEKYRAIARKFAKRVQEKYGDRVDSIILFGSAARGEAREESDIDILVVGEVTLDELVDVSVPMLLEYEEYISAQDMETARFNRLVKQGYSFIKNIQKEGVILFERV
jgi:predicted nucleotidyltransferase